MRESAALLATWLIQASGGRESAPSSDARVDLGTHCLPVRHEGSGGLPVVLVSGLTEVSDEFDPSQARLSKVTGVAARTRRPVARRE